MTSDFELLPAIDLRGGRVVRLEQGDFERETAYRDDPVAVATAFAGAGAGWLHVVDLDAARTGEAVNGGAIAAIIDAVGTTVRVEAAGGIRTPEAVDEMLARGATRVVVGTAAIRDTDFAAQIVAAHGARRVAVALDVRDGRASGDGWRRDALSTDALDALDRLADAGVETFEVTAIDRDGLLQGPDLGLLERVVARGRGRIIASAGISSAADIAAVKALGCAGAIVGRALYEGQLSFTDAIAAAARP